jgi:hypothetical protein
MQISSDNVQFVNQLVSIGIPITLVAIIGNFLLFSFCLTSMIVKMGGLYDRIMRGMFVRLSSAKMIKVATTSGICSVEHRELS